MLYAHRHNPDACMCLSVRVQGSRAKEIPTHTAARVCEALLTQCSLLSIRRPMSVCVSMHA
eukprot:6183725-Pleurochrysis_carterae.AAC.1